jgi:hypothetical protein
MEITDINPNTLVDLFSQESQENKQNATFTGVTEQEVDLFEKKEEDKPIENQQIDENKEVDILEKVEVKPSKNQIGDIASFFEERVKAGKFLPIEEDGPDGEKIQFVPKTIDDLDEVLEIQVEHKLNEAKKDLEEKWYEGKSDAWKAIAKYSEMTDDPREVVPFLTGVKNIESVANLDPKDLKHAEQIIRTRLYQRGETEDLVEEQIEALKTTNRLEQTAEKYKPLIIKEEQDSLNKMISQKKQEQYEWETLVQKISQNAIKAIEEPFVGKIKLKQDEKVMVYDLIGHPSQETKGYKIYNAIDNLFENNKFDVLKKIALLIAKEDSFMSYISSESANKTAEGLQRQLRVADNKKNISTDFETNTAQRQDSGRTIYKQTRFGR